MFAKRCKFRTVSTKSVHPFQPNRVFDESQPWIAGPDYSLSTTPSTCTATRNLITGPDYSLSATPSTCTATHSHPKPDYWPGLWLFSHSQHLHSNPFPTRNPITGPDYGFSATPSTCTATRSQPEKNPTRQTHVSFSSFTHPFGT